MFSILFYILAVPALLSTVFAAGTPRVIHPDGDTTKCLDVRGAMFVNGTPVQIYACNGTPAQKWVFTPGSTTIQVYGKNLCLDAGSKPGSGVGLKIWTCYPNLAAQSWQYYEEYGTFELANKGQCIDLPNGVLTNGNQVQTWECADCNPNQLWEEA